MLAFLLALCSSLLHDTCTPRDATEYSTLWYSQVVGAAQVQTITTDGIRVLFLQLQLLMFIFTETPPTVFIV